MERKGRQYYQERQNKLDESVALRRRFHGDYDVHSRSRRKKDFIRIQRPEPRFSVGRTLKAEIGTKEDKGYIIIPFSGDQNQTKLNFRYEIATSVKAEVMDDEDTKEAIEDEIDTKATDENSKVLQTKKSNPRIATEIKWFKYEEDKSIIKAVLVTLREKSPQDFELSGSSLVKLSKLFDKKPSSIQNRWRRIRTWIIENENGRSGEWGERFSKPSAIKRRLKVTGYFQRKRMDRNISGVGK